jgi:hypothetical protein
MALSRFAVQKDRELDRRRYPNATRHIPDVRAKTVVV